MGTSEKLLDTLYNKKLPQIYRDEDSKIGFPLKRYLESLVEGGYKSVIEDIEKILLLTDPKAIPEEMFPFLCKSFGLEYFPDIDITYQRKFLLNLGELIKRRGTFSSVHYMIRVLTGLESKLELSGDNLSIVLLAKDIEQMLNLDISTNVVRNYIRTQVPYYINPVISAHIATQVIESKSYASSVLSYRKHYQLNKEGN